MEEELSGLTALIVEYEPAMRGNLRGMLNMCGLTDIDQAPSANVALGKLRNRTYDLVLCEYFLGQGQDGQHLLEDARIHKLLPLATVFIMVTAESSYERVVGAAEYAPNDYILKPFAGDTLLDRVQRAFEKRAAFMPAYRLIDLGNVQSAITYCAAAAERFPPYAIDFLRLQAELHLAVGETQPAEEIYQRVLETRVVPWARLGLGKTLFLQKRFEEAEQQLGALIGESRHYLDAYDWLARVQEAAGSPQNAQQVIEQAVAVSPHALRRLKRLGDMALENGDLKVAERALAEAVRKGKYSEFRDPEDHVKLVRTLVGKGDVDQARKVARDLERSMQGVRKTRVCSALSAALIHTGSGEQEKAVTALNQAVEACREESGVSAGLKLELARGCIRHKLEDAAAEVMTDVMRNASDDVSLDKAKRVLSDAGMQGLADDLALKARTEVAELVAAGAHKAEEGDFEGSVSLMLRAARQMPGNVHVALNAALALLKYLEHRGWNEKFAAQARGFIEAARQADPANARIAPLSGYYHGLLRKYGIQPGRAGAAHAGPPDAQA